jgi:Lyase
VALEISRLTGYPFVTAPNKYAAQASLDAMVNTSSVLRLLAVLLMKITNDIRWLGSGPRAWIHDLILPGSIILVIWFRLLLLHDESYKRTISLRVRWDSDPAYSSVRLFPY